MKTMLAFVLLLGWPMAFLTAQDAGALPTDKQALIADSGQDPVLAELTRAHAKLIAKGARGSWSPDGKRIAIGKMPFGQGVCFVQVVGPDEDPSAPRIPFAFGKPFGEVTEFLPDGKDPTWSPDGRWIAFTREIDSGGNTTEEIWLTVADQVVAGKPVPGPLRRLGIGVMATWSADATTVFFSSPRTREILSVRVDKPDAEPATIWKAIGDRFPDLWYPIVAPNGRYVAYHADGQLRIADMTAQKVVSSWPLDGWRGFLAGWSPDGSRLGYGAFGGEDKGLWLLRFPTAVGGKPVHYGKPLVSRPTRLLGGSSTLPSWSPDGSKLAFDFRVPLRGYEVWVVSIDRASAEPQLSSAKHADADPQIRLFDGFDGRLALNWQPIRPDPSHVSLDKHPGKLTIVTQRGSIHVDEKSDAYGGGIQAKNIFVIDNPCSAETDFMMTTCVEDFTPRMQYQQAGLICYDDDDNYLKWGYEFCWPKGAGHTFTCVREVSQKSNFDVAEAKPGITKYWLRIIKRGNRYQYAYSYDGEAYVTVGEQTWGEGKPKKLGVLAKNGGNPDATELECKFDFFELRSLPLETTGSAQVISQRAVVPRMPHESLKMTGGLRSISLGPRANQSLNTSFNEDGPDNSLMELAGGVQKLGGVMFRIEPGCIRLRGNQRPKLPQAAEGIPVGFCLDKLHLLHATEFGAFGDESHPFFVKDGTHIGDYKVHYGDGSTATISIVYGEDVRDWWNWDKSKETKRGKVVWTGKNANAGKYDVALRLYLTTWDNPKPDLQVTTIDYVSVGQTAAGPFCVAITAHELLVRSTYHLKHASAEAIAKELTTLFAERENCRFAADARKNVVIAFGTADQQKKIQETIRSRDVLGTPLGRDVEEGMMIDAIEDKLPDSRTP